MIEINLLPGAQRKARSASLNASASAALATVTGKLHDKYLIGAVASVAVAAVALAGMYVQQDRQQSSLAERQRVASQDSVRYTAVLAARSGVEAGRDSVYRQFAIIKSIDDSRYLWPHVMDEVSRALPQYTWLTEVKQTSPLTSAAAADTAKVSPADTAKGKTTGAAAAVRKQRARADSLLAVATGPTKFRIVGRTVDIQALTRFMTALEGSPFVRNVQLTRSDLVTADGKEVTEFQLEAETETPPRALIRTIPLSVAVR